MDIRELRAFWEKEKDEYRHSEIGSGVQTFVWEVLKNSELFGLKHGLKSTPDQKRRNEFLLEEAKGGGRADAVIFIDRDIAVPVEVERLDKAASGEWQILKYRSAFAQRYGILTDGFEWRFYYGQITDNRHYPFDLDEMLAAPDRFHTFWADYTRPENYYRSFFEEVGGRPALAALEKSVDQHRDVFFRDVTKIISGLKDKLLNAGYLGDVRDEKVRERKATELAYSYLIQFVLYKTLVDNAFQDFANDYAKKREAIRKNLARGAYTAVLSLLEGVSAFISKDVYKPFLNEQSSIVADVTRLVRAGEDDLLSVAPFLDIFVFISKYNFGNVRNEIFGVVYENYLKELFDENLGQYFTDGAVVDFMLEECGYSATALTRRGRDEISIVDPSCGSGTFLYSAVRELVAARNPRTLEESKATEEEVLENVYGLDISEFPLYLAEMSILMRLLPMIISERYNNPFDKKLRLFYTKDSVAEFLGSTRTRVARGLGRDEGQMALPLKYDGFMRDEQDLRDMKRSLNIQGSGKTQIPRRRFDFVVGNPPYISYNESSSMGIEVMKRIKDRTTSLSDIHGWNLHSAPGRAKKYPPKPNLYAFFLALGFALLKKNGKLCFIVPRTLVTESDYDVVRYHLSHDHTIEKLISFGGHLFVGRGTSQKRQIATSSLIVVCAKEPAKKDHQVECLHYPTGDKDVRDVFKEVRANRTAYSKRIPQQALRDNVGNWAFVGWDQELLSLYEHYRQNSETMSVYSEHSGAETRFGHRFYFDVGFILDKTRFDATGESGKYALLDFKEFVNYSGLRPAKFYPRSPNGIEVPKASQGLEGLRRHKLVWQKSRSFKFHYTDVDVLPDMSFAQYIASDDRQEVLFLFAVLNSRLVRCIYRAMFELEPEKHGVFVVVKRIKEFVRPPLVNTPGKQALKVRIIALVDEALRLESATVGDLVKVDTLIQKFERAEVKATQLLLTAGGRVLKFGLPASAVPLVRAALERQGGPGPLSLSSLRSLPAFEPAAQRRLLDEADELLMDMYELKKGERRYVVARERTVVVEPKFRD